MKKTISLLSLFFIFLKAFSHEHHNNEEIKNPMHPMNFGSIIFDRLEYIEKDKSLGYKIIGFYGGDYNKLWLELEGKDYLKNSKGEIERADLLYGKAVSSFWDVRLGVGYAGDYNKGRKSVVLGLKGLAPYWFEVDSNIYLTEKGEVYLRFKAENDLLFTQQLILQPHFETILSNKKIENLELGSGLSKVSFSLRLRYELKREFAPYIGVSFDRFFGQTKELSHKSNESSFLIGIRMWF